LNKKRESNNYKSKCNNQDIKRTLVNHIEVVKTPDLIRNQIDLLNIKQVLYSLPIQLICKQKPGSAFQNTSTD